MAEKKIYEMDLVEIFNAQDTWTQSCFIALVFLIILAAVYDRYLAWKGSELNWKQFFNPFIKLETPLERKKVFIICGIFIFIIAAINIIYFLSIK